MIPAQRHPVADLAEAELRRFGGDDVSRELASTLLGLWPPALGLSDHERQRILARFARAEPPELPLDVTGWALAGRER